ncbi:uncharacterized protein LOC131005736 [Salvia miltiorrhiza]|uniref:uncharacterized protein LOC131005736 n=1 Tax=Salvia miltiorrhiza TaxID=226208 RepID=UPI0025AC16E2|nr:uncharacterized protein LOC131005736 [Salvia miltiorrhiza]
MGFLTQRVERSDLEAGDHIYTWRTPVFAYSHHGIYIGDNKVVHFTQVQNLSSDDSSSFFSSSSVAAVCLNFEEKCEVKKHKNGVVMSCLNCFLGNGSLYRFEYGVSALALVTKLRSGTCTTAKSDPPGDVIRRALYLLEIGFGKYDALSNNCEDFALYCKTGLVVIRQDDSEGHRSGQSSSVAAAIDSFIFSLSTKIFSSNPYVLGATTVGRYTFGRYVTDVGVRSDVIKLEVEAFALLLGELPAEDQPKKHGDLPAEEEDVCAIGGGLAENRPKKHGNVPAECDDDGVGMAEDRPEKHGSVPAEVAACADGVGKAADRPKKQKQMVDYHKPLKNASSLSPLMETKSASTMPQQDGGAAAKKQGLRKPVFVKVDSLKPGTNGHTLTVKVVTANTVLNKKPRNPTFRGPQSQNTKIAECLVGDDTGTILFTARNDQVEMMKPGNTVVLRNAKIDMFKGSMRLAVDKWGRIEVVEPEKFVVKEDNNLSLVEYELVNVVEES